MEKVRCVKSRPIPRVNSYLHSYAHQLMDQLKIPIDGKDVARVGLDPLTTVDDLRKSEYFAMIADKVAQRNEKFRRDIAGRGISQITDPPPLLVHGHLHEWLLQCHSVNLMITKLAVASVIAAMAQIIIHADRTKGRTIRKRAA